MLGLIEQFRPKFVRHYAELGPQVRAAVAAYVADVAEGSYASPDAIPPGQDASQVKTQTQNFKLVERGETLQSAAWGAVLY